MTRLSKNDPNSFSTPEDVIIKHIDLDWNVNFEKSIINGTALLKFEIIAKSISSIVSTFQLIIDKNIKFIIKFSF